MNARTAGHAYERKLAAELRDIGFPDCVTSRSESRRRDDQGVDFCYTGPLNIQAKRWKSAPSYHDTLASMPDEPGQINAIFHKRPHKGDVVVLSKSDFLEIVETLLRERIWKHATNPKSQFPPNESEIRND
jgi:hypothetical protein